jgi:hypothetical protein
MIVINGTRILNDQLLKLAKDHSQDWTAIAEKLNLKCVDPHLVLKQIHKSITATPQPQNNLPYVEKDEVFLQGGWTNRLALALASGLPNEVG